VFLGIALTHLVAIYKNKFLAENLSKLRRGRREEDTTGQITFLNGILITTRVKGSVKDFGSIINIWSEDFHNYMIANYSFYKVTFPELMYSMTCFYIKIANLTEYKMRRQAGLELRRPRPARVWRARFGFGVRPARFGVAASGKAPSAQPASPLCVRPLASPPV
jgi:hypothetical protein